MNPEIKKYISNAREKGLDDEEIRKNLKDAGWENSQVNAALGVEELAVPRPNSHIEEYRHLSNPLNSVLYIIAFILLLTAVFSGMWVLNNAVEYYLPTNPAFESSTSASSADIGVLPYYGGGISTEYENLYRTTTISFAFFAISLPLYLVVMSFLRSDEAKKVIVRKSWARKISYFIIIINCFVICVGAPVWVLYLLITGDFSANVILKFLANFSFNIFPLIYYFLQLRDDKKIFG